ncbi:MAG: S-layer homology domain-containing protein, partial [Candidatus Sericytochromatia bacterium]|nr:S-layer homology domain-containing protein [Candidatus Sericytochromatia bacterium]
MPFHHKKLANSVLVLLLSFTYPAFASRLYSDIPAGHWSENAADVLNEEHIMDGISSNEFGGNLPINRYDTAKIINGLMGNKSAGPGLILLSDVRSGNPYFTTIMKVLNANLMEVSNNKFSGDKKISRYDFAKYIIATLNYLQAEAISIRQSPKAIGNVAADKRDIINKSVNYWQLTDGYNDWDQNINRYSALEMVARAAININPDLRSRIGDVVRTGATPEPNKTPVPTIIPTTPTPTVAPTSIVPTVRPTPEATLVPTATPTTVSTPILSTPTPIAVPTPILFTPVPTALPTPTPIAVPTPIISTPTPLVTASPINTSITSNQILRNQLTLRGMYNLLYSESLPVEFDKIDNLKKKDDNLGISFSGEGSYWLKDYDIPFVKDMGLIFGVNALGSYGYPAETAVLKSDTEISETFKGNLSLMYKLYKNPDIEFAVGLDGFYRITSRNSTHIVDSYWRASKNY